MEPISYTNYSWSYQGIDGAVSSQELRQARVILQNELQELLSASLSPIEWYQTVNELHDRIARKAVELCIQGMVEEGFGQPPSPMPLSYLAVPAGKKQRYGVIRIMA